MFKITCQSGKAMFYFFGGLLSETWPILVANQVTYFIYKYNTNRIDASIRLQLQFSLSDHDGVSISHNYILTLIVMEANITTYFSASKCKL